MGKKGRVVRKRATHDQPSARSLRPGKERASSHEIHSEILQDGSLPDDRSLRSKSMQEKCEIGLVI
jgi:hypothetical protein